MKDKMKINEKHIRMMNCVMRIQGANDSLGGAMSHELVGLDGRLETSLKALVRNGYLEIFNTEEKSRSVIAGQNHHNSNGFGLYRLTTKGTAWLLEDAIEKEMRPIWERVAEKCRGLSPKTVSDASVEFQTKLYNDIAVELIKNREKS